MRANIQEMADIFGVARSTVSAWVDDGMPYAEAGSKGKPWIFDTAAAIAWFADNKARRRRVEPAEDGKETYEEAERRKMVAAADKAELELAKAAGLIVEISDVAAVVAEENARVRTHLLAIPNEVRTRVRSYLGGDRKIEEAVVGGVETAILDAMKEICEPSEIAEALAD